MDQGTQGADLILLGNIYTVNQKQPWVQAVAVSKGVIIYTGTKDDVQPFIRPHTVLLDSGEGLFLPGFYDAHIHAISGALIEMQCNLYSAKTIEDARKAILAYYQSNPQLEAITGSGWKHNWPGLVNGTVTAAMVDDLVPDKPLVIRRWDGHSVWVNSNAMKMAQITKETLQQYSPTLIPCDENGNPVGCFHEEAADIFLQFLKDIPQETREKALDFATRIFAQNGIVGWHDALARGGTLTLYLNACKSKKLNHKVGFAFWWDPSKDISQLEEFKKHMNKGTGREKAVIGRTVKIMLDGVIETQTALLHQPYCNCANNHDDGSEHTHSKPNYGLSQFGNDLDTIVALCDKEGFQVHVHAVGDKATTRALDAIEKARATNGTRDNRHELAHLQVVQPADIPRFKELDVLANFQPLWCESTLSPDADVNSWIGPERTRLQYPIKQMAELGTKICFGSDWHVSDFEPLFGIHVAVNHRLKPEHPVWKPEEVLSLEQAIQYYTLGSAYACFREKESGSIEVGKACDVILLEKNLFQIDPMEIKDTKVLKTIIDGQIVYDSCKEE